MIADSLRYLGCLRQSVHLISICPKSQMNIKYEMCDFFVFLSKNGCKDQKSIQSSTTPNPGYHMGK